MRILRILLMENLKKMSGVEDLKWDGYEKGDGRRKVRKEDVEKGYERRVKKVNEGEVVEGSVMGMKKGEVVVKMG